MEVMKDIKDIKWNTDGISEPIVMASAAGWYVGTICKDPDCGGMIVPYNRYTDYMTQENAQKCLDTPMEQGGFYEG